MFLFYALVVTMAIIKSFNFLKVSIGLFIVGMLGLYLTGIFFYLLRGY